MACRTLPADHDDFGSIRSEIMDVIDSKVLERDAGARPVSTFPRPAPERLSTGRSHPVGKKALQIHKLEHILVARIAWIRAEYALAAITALIVALAGCSNYDQPRRPPWRTQAEKACLAQGLVRPSAVVQPAAEIDGPSICGLTRPFKVSALQDGAVTLSTTATLDCSMIAALDSWLGTIVLPAARARLGASVTAIRATSAYSCRTANNRPGARLSEHAFGNAFDVGGFRLDDGREISIARDWTDGDEASRAFLRDIHAGACGLFTTVLGPGADVFHYNHFHVDLAMHGTTPTGPRHICRPRPQQAPLPRDPHDGLPDAPAIEDAIEVAQAKPRSERPAVIQPGPGPAPIAAVPTGVATPVARPRTFSAFAPMPPGVASARAPTPSQESKPADWDLSTAPVRPR
jgi:hypothetical protein